MMITLPEVTAAIHGVGRLLRLDTSGYSYLDTSRRGFFMSFWAAVFILPGIFILGRFDPAAEELGVHPFRFLSVTAIHYVLSWVIYPLVMWHVAERLGRLNRYVLYIVAYNWAGVLQIAILAAIETVGQTGLLPPGFADLVSFMVIVTLLVWSGYVAKTAMDVSVPVAAALVGFEIVLAVALFQIRTMLIY
ncbi:MAG: hypothetical protein RIC36_09265 [Rhodospirillales bacterium]